MGRWTEKPLDGKVSESQELTQRRVSGYGEI